MKKRLVLNAMLSASQGNGTHALTIGTTMMTMRTAIPIAMMTRIFMSFHHICFLTRFAPRRNPWAETARLSDLVSRH